MNAREQNKAALAPAMVMRELASAARSNSTVHHQSGSGASPRPQ